MASTPTKTALLFADTACAPLVPDGDDRHFMRIENLGTTKIRFGFSNRTAAEMRTDGHILEAAGVTNSVFQVVGTDTNGRNLPRAIYAAAATANVDVAVSCW